MKKRYAITIDDLAMKQVRVEAIKAGLTVGDWITSHLRPFDQDVVAWTQDPESRRIYDETREATVDNIKKAIETDQVKRQPRGRLTKGLGEDAPQPRQADERPAPGWTPSFNPAPKPSKGK
jgi:hypothetical protein